MNDKQFEQAERQLREEMKSHGFGWIDGTYVKPPEEYHICERVLSCISMINSILAYGKFGFTAEQVLKKEENSYHNYLADYVKELGRARVIALIQGQIDSMVDVRTSVFIDSEGLSYNSIVWKEE